MNPAISTFLGLVLFVSGCTVNTKEQEKTAKVIPSKINVTVKKQSSLMDPESKQERPKQKTAHTKIGSLQNKTAPEIILALGTPDFRRTDRTLEVCALGGGPPGMASLRWGLVRPNSNSDRPRFPPILGRSTSVIKPI